MKMKELCLVHLVRASNDVKYFIRFLESYRENKGNIEHDLLIIFKGFTDNKDKVKYERLLSSFQYVSHDISDQGFDINAYFATVNVFHKQYNYFCFVNSFSVILDDEWLNKLYLNIIKSDVGLVGATGSWQSLRGNMPTWKLPFSIALSNYNLSKKLISSIRAALKQNFNLVVNFRAFPNYHIRTNVFMISGKLMQSLNCNLMIDKMDAYRFESGRNGFSRQILSLGKKIIVVGKDGHGYDKNNWDKSKTFWQQDQENLLVADNQTDNYMNESNENREKLSSYAWGDFFSFNKQ